MTAVVLLIVGVQIGLAEEVRFETKDGVTIVGDYFAPAEWATDKWVNKKAPVVVLLHMYRSDRSAWRTLTPKLHEAGFAVLAIDMRGHGDSQEPLTMELKLKVASRDAGVFQSKWQDVAAAKKWLSEREGVDSSQLGIVGASVGCSVALDYGRRDEDVKAIACMTPGRNYLHLDSVEHIKAYGDRPVLMLATAEERLAAEELAKLGNGAKAEIVAPGKHHGTRMFGVVDGIEDRIVLYLGEVMGES
jgi:dienelactone hydrolase